MLNFRNITSNKDQMDFLILSSFEDFKNNVPLESYFQDFQSEAKTLHDNINSLIIFLKEEYNNKDERDLRVSAIKNVVNSIEKYRVSCHRVNAQFENVLPTTEIDSNVDLAIEHVNQIKKYQYEMESVENAKKTLKLNHMKLSKECQSVIGLIKKISYLINSPMRGRIIMDDSREKFNFEIVEFHQSPYPEKALEYKNWAELVTKFYYKEIQKNIEEAKRQFQELIVFASKQMFPMEKILENMTLGEFIKARSDLYSIHFNNISKGSNFSYHYFRLSEGYNKFEKVFLAKIEDIQKSIDERSRKLLSQNLEISAFFNMNVRDFLLEKRSLREVNQGHEKGKVTWGHFLIEKDPGLRPLIEKMIKSEISDQLSCEPLSSNVFIKKNLIGHKSEIIVTCIKGDSSEKYIKKISEDFKRLEEVDRRVNIMRLRVDKEISIDVEVEVTTLQGSRRSLFHSGLSKAS